MKLTKQTMVGIERDFVASGKSDMIIFDDTLRRFGLRLRASGHRAWIVQFERGGKAQRVTLGNASVLTVEQARHLAKEQLAKVDLGQDVSKERADAKVKARRLLGPIVEQYLQARKPELRPSTFQEVSRYLTKDFRSLHHMPIAQIQRGDIAAVLRDLAKHPSAAAVARSALITFFAWAVREGFCDANPVVNTNKVKPGKARERVLSDQELARVWNACLEDDYGRIVRLLILTGARRDEIAGMEWSEFNQDNRTWTLPTHRAKNKHALTLTLPAIAWDIIASVEAREFNQHLFGSGKNGFTHWASKTALDERSGVNGWVLHDLRRTAATGMVSLGIQPHHVEAVLNHVGGHKGGVAGIYNRATYVKEIRNALAIWADHVHAITTGTERKIIPIPGSTG